MKTLFTLGSILSLVVLFSCSETVVGPEGPRGATGPAGPQGAPGDNGFVFEFEAIDFTSGNNYEVFLEYPSDFEGLQSDVALVYLLWAVDNDEGDIWRPLDQQLLFDDGGILNYKYDFTQFSTRLFLEANFSRNELAADLTDQWVARVVIVPGAFWNSGRKALPDYKELEEALGLPELGVRQTKPETYHRPE